MGNYIGVFPREKGKLKFLQRSDADPELIELASNGHPEAFKSRINLTALNHDDRAGCHPGMTEWMSEGEYYEFWDTQVDKRGLFRGGLPTIEALRAIGGCPNDNNLHRSEEQMDYEEMYQQALIDQQKAEEMEVAAARLNMLEYNAYHDTAEEIREQRGISADNEYKAMKRKEAEMESVKRMIKGWPEEKGKQLMDIYLEILHR